MLYCVEISRIKKKSIYIYIYIYVYTYTYTYTYIYLYKMIAYVFVYLITFLFQEILMSHVTLPLSHVINNLKGTKVCCIVVKWVNVTILYYLHVGILKALQTQCDPTTRANNTQRKPIMPNASPNASQ